MQAVTEPWTIDAEFMNKSVKAGIISVLLAMSIVANKAPAATAGAANVFLNVNIVLTGVDQISDNGVARIRLTSQDVIGAIGHDTTNSFPFGSKLLLKFPVGQEAGPSFVVRSIINRTNVVDFDVPSNILWFVQLGDWVGSSRTNLLGVITVSQTTIWEVEFQSSVGSFDVQGFTTAVLDNRGNLGANLVDTCPITVSSRVNGTGSDVAGNSTVLQGSIILSGRKILDVH